jgi:hypothetical protein
VLPRRLRRSAAAVLVLAAGGCRERAGGGRAGRFLAGADRALRRLGAEISAAEAGGLLTPERALRLLELQVSTGLVLAARCRTADVAPPRACRASA